MAFRDLFVVTVGNRPRKPLKGQAVAAAAAPSGQVGVFITPQSLASFPVASSVVVVIWSLFKSLFPTWGASKLVPLVASFLVGLLVFLINISDPQAAPKGAKAWLLGIAIAAVNCLFLASAALGILR